MRAMLVALMCVGCSSETMATPDASYGPSCRAVTVEGGIEYDCLFDDGELGVCGTGPTANEPTCHHLCPAGECTTGRLEVITNSDGTTCYCR